ncbi:MAG: helicase C-terminal domain-containing protein [Planctomycetota bacterium]
MNQNDSLTFAALITTGPMPERDQILEAAAVRMRGDEEVEMFAGLACPEELPLAVQRLTGLDEARVKDRPSPRKVAAQLSEFSGTDTVVTYGAADFRQFLSNASAHPPDELYDAQKLARVVRPDTSDYQLESLAGTLGVEGAEMHRALDLARLTRRVWDALLEELYEMPGPVLGALHRIAEASASNLTPLLADALNRKEGFELGRQTGSGLDEVMPDHTEIFKTAQEYESPEPTDEPLDMDKICAMFRPDGAIGRHLNGYEQRDEQLEMVVECCQALSTPYHLMFEAGTGTGKSMAYLLPAIAWARQNEDKVIVSTNTKNLQEQLYNKDLPFLEELLGGRFDAALLKGRRNYLCVRRFMYLMQHFERELGGPEQMEAMMPLIPWVADTEDGDLAGCRGLLRDSNAYPLLPRVTSSGDECAGRACPYRKSCFVFRARTMAQLADLVVVNHSLLFSEIGLDTPILPEHRCLIFDEAHNVEDIATDAIARVADNLSFYRVTNRLWRARQDGSGSGMVATIMSMADKKLPEKGPLSRDTVKSMARGVIEQVDAVVDTTRECFQTLARPFERVPHYEDKIMMEECKPPITMDGETGQAAGALDKCVSRLGSSVEDLAECLELNKEKMEEAQQLARDLRAQANRLEEAMEDLKFCLKQEREKFVYWLERSESGNRTYYSMHAAPLDIGEFFKDYFFEDKRTVIMTSATMRVGGSFDYMRERLGAEEMKETELWCAAVGSPFNYHTQTLMAVPTFLPDAGGRRSEDYDEQLSELLIDLLRTTRGRALVLFTSYSLLNGVYDAIKRPLEREGVPVLAQGRDGSRGTITSLFREVTGSVLLGTQSFWEGVDISGETLSCLVLTKLPFHVFTEPLVRGRIEYLRARGINPFGHYTLPEAVITFRQGFGRLIRHRNDSGVVVVTDRRLVTKSYGRNFLRDIPAEHTVFKQKKPLMEAVGRFLGQPPL